MIIAGLDIETTGLLEPEHRIIEVYIGLWDFTSRKLVDEFDQRIDPERAITIDAQRVHGISTLDLSGKPKFSAVASRIHAMLGDADLIAAHNGKEFDLPFVNQELERVGMPRIDTPVFDTMLEARWATANGKVPNLKELCFACDVEYDPAKAHAASYDVAVMIESFFRGLDWGWFKLEKEMA